MATETTAQREERRRRAAEVALMRFDGLDDVRLLRHRKSQPAAGGRTSVAAGKRAALEAFARNNGLTMAELERLRAGEALRHGMLLAR
jgi:hypothetical protein